MEIKFWIDENEKTIFKCIELSNKQGNKLYDSHNILSGILKCEELYDQIIESHLAFKTELYSSALSRVGNSRIDYIANHEARSKLNRSVFNTLNLSKLYLDKHYFTGKNKIKCFASEITGDDKIEEKIKKNREEIYNNSVNYRLGYELRRIAQHSTLPVNNITSGFINNKPNNQSEINAHYNLPIQKKLLLDYNVSKSLLESFNETIDLHKVMDEYIYQISKMHELNRELTESTIKNAKIVFNNLYNDTELNHGKAKFGIDVHNNEGKLFSLELDWFDVVDYLQSKHAFPINHRMIYHNTYLTEQQKTR